MKLLLVCAFAVLAGACGISSDVSRDLGARCDSTDECNERCLLPSIPEAPGGFCTLECTSDSDCPGGSVCVDLEGGVCLFSCMDAMGCEFLGTGWSCASRTARPDGEVMVCIGN